MQHMLYGTPASNAVVNDLMRSCPPPNVMVEVPMDKAIVTSSSAFEAIAAVADQLYDCISSGLVGVLEAEGWYSDTQNPSDFTFFVGRERNMLNYHLSNYMKRDTWRSLACARGPRLRSRRPRSRRLWRCPTEPSEANRDPVIRGVQKTHRNLPFF